ncbi:MAG TPA: hypothetical protein VLC48_11685, partial [Gemmatimonadota bacterium]|nr:hypothetical protein [Gemmatimonadota bacterium]
SLDLPVILERGELNEDSTRLREGRALDVLESFAELKALDPGIAAVISDVGLESDGNLMASLQVSQPANRLALPSTINETLLRRIRATLADLRSRGIEAELIEARFAEQIVVRRKSS